MAANKVLVGANIEVFIKGRKLRYVTGFRLVAKPKSVCYARVKYFECSDDGRVKTITVAGRTTVKENEFGAFCTGINERNGRFQFHVFPKGIRAGKANDFTKEDELFLLDEILKCCLPFASETPDETIQGA